MSDQDIQIQLNAIKDRNQRVEADKAWETSWTRKILVAILTYLVILIFLIMIKAEQPFITAIVPTVGFILSTASLSLGKRIWLKQPNKLLISILVIFFVLIIALGLVRLFSGEDDWICQNGQWIKHGQPEMPAPTTDCK